MAAALCTALPAAAERAEEYDVKAVFLYNFTLFAKWPREAFASAEAPMQLCVLGDDPFEGSLEEVVQGERVEGRPLVVRHLASAEQAGQCQVLFLPRGQDAGALRRVPGIERGMILTVGESEDFLARGGLVRFVTREGRIRLQINGPLLDEGRLELSSKLLRLAERVKPGSR